MDVVRQIMALSGDMPDREAHRRYLAGLSAQQRSERLLSLQAERAKGVPGFAWRRKFGKRLTRRENNV